MELIMLVLMETNPWLPTATPSQQPPHQAYRQTAGKGDDDETPAVCSVCLGAQGEWIEMNGKKGQERKWVPCKACNGTGRR
ncbi:hypothetical protein [Nonomuraea sp. NPDC049709]|uniref:hypothetical protein n=1 Tax=Nonomuraea sp. NPDC049709 TaxID=3154736 RepID=UPI00343B3275